MSPTTASDMKHSPTQGRWFDVAAGGAIDEPTPSLNAAQPWSETKSTMWFYTLLWDMSSSAELFASRKFFLLRDVKFGLEMESYPCLASPENLISSRKDILSATLKRTS